MQYTYFFNLTSPFSNFHPSKFIYKNVQFISNEQFMMFCKAKQFKDETTALKILKINEMDLPARFINNEVSREEIVQNQVLCDTWKRLMMDIKKLGREVSGYDDAIWNEKRYNIVKYGAKEKFVQNEDLCDILLNTGKTRMCEAAGHDKIWGCGLTEYNAKKTAPENWPGLNLLGHALDEVKKYLFENKNQEKTEDKIIANVEVHNFYTLGKKIPDDGTYIGRYNKQYGLNKSIFANPYKVETPEERGSTIEKYRDWLWNEIAKNQITKNDLISLNNRKLVCYCAPKACHGNVLKETVELLIKDEVAFDEKVKSYKEQLISNSAKSPKP